ncbi:perlucin-like protein [Acanthaster planci]|uniref:Perlucin-like protein n=1 Tax=Acanthaster planci TaxID=133434 RepID=A0A8B8A1V9_ACAPL|nr:perlucin-like protein [Acanthaster planci]
MCLFKVLLLLSSVVISVVGKDTCPSSAIASCPPSWQPWGGYCYRFTDEKADWNQSKLACQAIGGVMGVPYSPEENEFMMQMARKENITHFWIGCSDTEKEGTWVCEGQGKGEPFFNWSPGEPNNSHDNEDCVEIWLGRIGSMNDESCNKPFGAICGQRQATCLQRPIQPACGYQPHPAHHYCFATDGDGQLLSSCLLDHVIREFATKTNPYPGCAFSCMKESTCRSFNIKHNDQGHKICQLNNATRSEDPAKFQDVGTICNYAQECVG